MKPETARLNENYQIYLRSPYPDPPKGRVNCKTRECEHLKSDQNGWRCGLHKKEIFNPLMAGRGCCLTQQ
jgi:hypothetical protein